MPVLTHDELRDMARPTRGGITTKAAQAEEKARADTTAAWIIQSNLSDIVPVKLWFRGGLHSQVSVHLYPLPLENAIDMLGVHPPVMLTQLSGSGTYPTETITEREREGIYRDVAPFYIRAQYDLHENPKGTRAKLCWWSHLLGDEYLVEFSMPLLNVIDYLVCQYAMESPRSSKVRFNKLRTRLPGVQAQIYSGGDRSAPRHFYLYWDYTTTITDIINNMQEDWNEC